MIKTRNIDVASPARYVRIVWTGVGTLPVVAAGTPVYNMGVYPYAAEPKTQAFSSSLPSFGKIVDVVFGHAIAGTGGTSVVYNVKKNGTTIFTTNCTILPTAAAALSFDTKLELGSAVLTGVTRPVLKTDSTIYVKKGDIFSVDTTITGVYTLNPAVSITLVIDPQTV